MKRYNIFLLVIAIPFFSLGAQETHVVESSGLSFTPDALTISVNDKVQFDVGTSHPVLEVTETDWDANSSTAKAEGFAFPTGEGTQTFTEIGTYYYVCTNHIASGMKGKITVQEATSTESTNDKDSFVTIEGNYLNLTMENRNAEMFLYFYSLDGKLVQKVIMSRNQIYLPDILDKGMYLMLNEQNKASHKIIVQ